MTFIAQCLLSLLAVGFSMFYLLFGWTEGGDWPRDWWAQTVDCFKGIWGGE